MAAQVTAAAPLPEARAPPEPPPPTAIRGAGATFLQSLGQRRASAPQAQLWFALTPAFGATWAYLVLGEQCTFHQVTGAAFLLGAIALSVPALESPPGSAPR